MFHWQTVIPPAGAADPLILAGFTDRTMGVGAGTYGGFNLGGHVGDDPGVVEANRRLLAAALGVERERLLFMSQVHGATVLDVTRAHDAVGDADAMVTATPGLALAVLVADCVPVLLHDAQAGVIAAVHCGRLGMTSGIVGIAVERMRAQGADRISAVVGPSVCARCYEVPEPMAKHAAAVSAASAGRSWTGTPAIDVAAGVVEQLSSLDVAVHWIPGCTREEDRLYSHRRDGRTGRFAGVIVMRPVDHASTS